MIQAISHLQAFTCAVGFSSQPFSWLTPNLPSFSTEEGKTGQEEKWSTMEAGGGDSVKGLMVNGVQDCREDMDEEHEKASADLDDQETAVLGSRSPPR